MSVNFQNYFCWPSPDSFGFAFQLLKTLQLLCLSKTYQWKTGIVSKDHKIKEKNNPTYIWFVTNAAKQLNKKSIASTLVSCHSCLTIIKYVIYLSSVRNLWIYIRSFIRQIPARKIKKCSKNNNENNGNMEWRLEIGHETKRKYGGRCLI